MDLDNYLMQAWDTHAADPAGVAFGLAGTGLAMVQDAQGATRLAQLAHHIHGAHLADWAGGHRLMQALLDMPCVQADTGAAAGIERFVQALNLAGEAQAPPARDEDASGTSETSRVAALAAGSLAQHDAVRCEALLTLAQRCAQDLPAHDPAHRTLAAQANNIAADFAEASSRSAGGTQLMLHAAQLARAQWAIAGTWLEVERAEYRLAACHLAASNLAAAQRHTSACLQGVATHGDVPLEAFFAWEMQARVARAQAHAPLHQQALAQAQAAFSRLAPEDQAWCRPSLDAAMKVPLENA